VVKDFKKVTSESNIFGIDLLTNNNLRYYCMLYDSMQSLRLYYERPI